MPCRSRQSVVRVDVAVTVMMAFGLTRWPPASWFFACGECAPIQVIPSSVTSARSASAASPPRPSPRAACHSSTAAACSLRWNRAAQTRKQAAGRVNDHGDRICFSPLSPRPSQSIVFAGVPVHQLPYRLRRARYVWTGPIFAFLSRHDPPLSIRCRTVSLLASIPCFCPKYTAAKVGPNPSYRAPIRYSMPRARSSRRCSHWTAFRKPWITPCLHTPGGYGGYGGNGAYGGNGRCGGAAGGAGR